MASPTVPSLHMNGLARTDKVYNANRSTNANTINANTMLANPMFGSIKILLVDDEPSTLRLVRKFLQADGHEIYEATDGQQAIEVFEATKPDLVLLDVVMPKMDGLAALEEIRKRDEVAGVIMVSALTSEQLAVRSMLAGADDYVSKPFQLKAIRMNIRRVMEKVRLRRQNVELREELFTAHNRLQQAHGKLREIFNLYMAPSLVEKLMASPTLPELGGERQTVTVLFMDFCGFTRLSNRLPPDEVLHILNDYLALVTTTVTDNNGHLDKIMGDGFMALFPANDDLYHAKNAIRSAMQMRRRVNEWRRNYSPQLELRVGINTGPAVVGNIGTQEMMNYTAIGDTVNLAKRLEESGQPGQILVSNSTYQLLDPNALRNEAIDMEFLGGQPLKGFQYPMDIYQAVEHEIVLNSPGKINVRNTTDFSELLMAMPS